MPSGWRKAVQFPYCVPFLSIYPLLFVASANPGQVYLGDLLIANAIAVAAGGFLLLLSRAVAPSWQTAALATVAIVGLFFAYGPVHSSIELELLGRVERRHPDAAVWLSRLDLYLSVVWAGGVVLVVVLARAVAVGTARKLVAALNVSTAVLLVLVLPSLVSAARPVTVTGSNTVPSLAATGPSADQALPDIYYIILDGYGRSDILEKHFQFSNAPFLGELRKRGFSVSQASSANYSWTYLSLASSLNLDYLQPLFGQLLDPEMTDRSALYEAIRDNSVARTLRGRGYRFVHLQSTWGATARNPYADEFLSCHSGAFDTEFYRAVAEASWLRILNSATSADLAECHLANLQTLSGLAATAGSKFVLAHFLPPHHPYLFDRDGNVLRAATIKNQFEFQKRLWGRKDLYIGQIEYMNARMIRVIDDLLRNSPRPPIVILQSDHGPTLLYATDRNERDRARLANLTASYLPDAPDGLVPDDVTPVNLFRIVLNFYFGASLPLLPSRHYVSSFDQPYAFQEVQPDGLSADSGS